MSLVSAIRFAPDARESALSNTEPSFFQRGLLSDSRLTSPLAADWTPAADGESPGVHLPPIDTPRKALSFSRGGSGSVVPGGDLPQTPSQAEVQGYLAYKKMHSGRTLPQAFA